MAAHQDATATRNTRNSDTGIRGVISAILPRRHQDLAVEPAEPLAAPQAVPQVSPAADVVNLPALAATLVFVIGLTLLEAGLNWASAPSALAEGAFVVSAVLKAVLVAAVFMRLLWDRGFHTIFVAVTLAFYTVLLVMCVADRREYDWATTISSVESR